MNEQHDAWNALSHQWQTEEAAPAPELDAGIAAEYRRASLRRYLSLALQLAIVALYVAWSVEHWQRELTVFEIGHLAYAWTLLLTVVVFAWSNSRGTWRADGETTAHYLAIWERRAQSKHRTAQFVLWLSAVATAASIGISIFEAWWLDLWERLPLSVGFMGTLWVLYLGWALWFRGRALRELGEVRAIREEVVSEPEAANL